MTPETQDKVIKYGTIFNIIVWVLILVMKILNASK